MKKFLGKDFDVVASAGHVADLPDKPLSVDIKNGFAPTYAVYPEKKSIVKAIKDKAKSADTVYLMSDLDREGEAIAWHISQQLPPDTDIKRAVTASITSDAVKKAISDAGSINMDLVHSYECRRIIDRLCGYKTSFPTKQATGGASAGRVQSAALRILAEREKEIQGFTPIEYWPIEVTLERPNGERFIALIKQPPPLKVGSEKEATDIISVLKKGDWVVSKCDTKEADVKAFAPFTTSSLYQAASSIYGWSTKKTASVAQELYEDGHITYIRTDSTYIVPDVVSGIRSTIPSRYGNNYLPAKANVFSNKKTAQEAHEAIRMTEISSESVSTGDKQKLYRLIWKRTIASQMADMKQLRGSAEFTCEKYIFGLTASKILFDGWAKVWDYGNYSDAELPDFKVGEKLKFIEAKTEQKFTTPPSRYTEASFVKELEKRGIGRPSTYKTIIDVLEKRKYVETAKKSFHVTDMGLRVTDFLVQAGFCFVDLDFTARLEEDLDRIAKNEVPKLEILQHFWDRLKSDLENAKITREQDSLTDYECPRCGGKLVKKYSRFGAFYVCQNRSDVSKKCEYKCQVAEDGTPVEREKAVLEKSDFSCPNCGKKMVKRTSKKGWEYLSCQDWAKDEGCRGFYDKDTGEKIVFEKRKIAKKNKGFLSNY